MIDAWPAEPPNDGTTVGPLNRGAGILTIRAYPGYWLVDWKSGIQSEIRLLDEGGYTVMHTNGTAAQTGSAETWREVGKLFFP